ncbi:hypothetical protein FKW77_007791 [Venturia effusa]|uniref:Uncharacterized protein n=1 Tax=Venturia effusa TaxID=50376 RepID=A0A517L1P5_9PEZI|nr:hypothetical protein FKW77_007791 [Venturia effusa]
MDSKSLSPVEVKAEDKSSLDVKSPLSDRYRRSIPIDFEQQVSAIRSTIQGSTCQEEDKDALIHSPLPFHHFAVASTPGSDGSLPCINRFGRMTMGPWPDPRYPDDQDAFSTSSDDDISDYEDRGVFPPQSKRRRVLGVIKSEAISPSNPAKVTSSPSTIKEESVETASVFPESSDIKGAFDVINTSSSAVVERAGIMDYQRLCDFGSRYMNVPREQTSSEEGVIEDEHPRLRIKKRKERNLWNGRWWQQVHEANGLKMKPREEGNNVVRERSEKLGGSKKG